MSAGEDENVPPRRTGNLNRSSSPKTLKLSFSPQATSLSRQTMRTADSACLSQTTGSSRQ